MSKFLKINSNTEECVKVNQISCVSECNDTSFKLCINYIPYPSRNSIRYRSIITMMSGVSIASTLSPSQIYQFIKHT